MPRVACVACRPPIAKERLETRPDGLVRITLKPTYADGTGDHDPPSLLCRPRNEHPAAALAQSEVRGVLASSNPYRPRIAAEPATRATHASRERARPKTRDGAALARAGPARREARRRRNHRQAWRPPRRVQPRRPRAPRAKERHVNPGLRPRTPAGLRPCTPGFTWSADALLAKVTERASGRRSLAKRGDLASVPKRSPSRGPPLWMSVGTRRQGMGDGD